MDLQKYIPVGEANSVEVTILAGGDSLTGAAWLDDQTSTEVTIRTINPTLPAGVWVVARETSTRCWCSHRRHQNSKVKKETPCRCSCSCSSSSRAPPAAAWRGDAMADPPLPPTVIVHAPPSTSVIGAITTSLDALKTSPVLLLIVLLNGFFCAAAGYYLLQVEAYRHVERRDVIDMLGRCMKSATVQGADHANPSRGSWTSPLRPRHQARLAQRLQECPPRCISA